MDDTETGFETLLVWQKAHRFVLDVYHLTKSFPDTERFSLTSQLQRAAISIPANIAEGYAKRSSADKARFYNISQGSISECRYFLILAHDLNYSDTTTLMSELDQVGRMLNSYTQKILSARS